MKFVTPVLLLLLMLLLLWDKFSNKSAAEELKEYWENKDFKTDTVIVEIDYTKLPIPTYEFEYIPPAVVVDYTAPPITNHVSLNLNDSLITVIDSLQNRIFEISAAYLKLYPNAYKLIYAEFTADSLRFDVLATTGRISSQRFAVNYERFGYAWKDNVLQAQPKAGNSLSKSMYGILYGYTGYEAVNSRSPILGADYSLYWNKLRFEANTYVTLESEPNLFLGGTLGIQLYGRRKSP